MKLTSYTNFAMRSLQLAALTEPERIRVGDVVRGHGLARPHVVKIVHEPGRAGLIETQRGRGELLARIAPIEEGIVAPVRRAT